MKIDSCWVVGIVVGIVIDKVLIVNGFGIKKEVEVNVKKVKCGIWVVEFFGLEFFNVDVEVKVVNVFVGILVIFV